MSEQTIYDGFLRFKTCKINGRTMEKVVRKNSVAVLVYNVDLDTFILTAQYRYPADCTCFEIVAGCKEPFENAWATSVREVEEEIGYKIHSKELKYISTFYTSPGTTNEQIELFYVEVTNAHKVSSGGGLKSEGEDIEVIEVCPDNALQFLRSAASQVAYFWWKDYRK